MARLCLVVAAALILCGVAGAATIDDLRALGYTAYKPNPSQPCWTVVGFGIDTSLGCEPDQGFQAALDSIANPAAHCNRVWQFVHPDQHDAFSNLASKGWGISGDQCADKFTVTNPNTGAVVYSGGGGGLAGAAASLGAPSVVVVGGPNVVPVPPQNCLPLCPTPSPVGVVPAAGAEPPVRTQIVRAGTAVAV